MHSVRIELTKLILVGTRITYQATGDAVHGHRRQCVSCIRNRGGLDLSYDAGASSGRCKAGRYVCCWCGVVWDVEGGGLPVRRHLYRGHRVELWRIADWLKTTKKKQSKVKQSRQLGCIWAFSGKTRHNAF